MSNVIMWMYYHFIKVTYIDKLEHIGNRRTQHFKTFRHLSRPFTNSVPLHKWCSSKEILWSSLEMWLHCKVTNKKRLEVNLIMVFVARIRGSMHKESNLILWRSQHYAHYCATNNDNIQHIFLTRVFNLILNRIIQHREYALVL